MADVRKAISLISGSEPTPHQVQRVQAIAHALDIPNSDPLLPILVALDQYHGVFGELPEKMRRAAAILAEKAPELESDGEMHGDSALDARHRLQIFPNAKMREDANLLIFPTLDAANIAFNLLKNAAGEGMTVGPILLGAAKPVHILTPSATVRRIINMTALTVVEAGQRG